MRPVHGAFVRQLSMFQGPEWDDLAEVYCGRCRSWLRVESTECPRDALKCHDRAVHQWDGQLSA